MSASTARNNLQCIVPPSATRLRGFFTDLLHLGRPQERAMKRLKDFLGASIPLALGAVFLGAASQSASAACLLNSPGGQIKHVVHIVFDNVHLRRDNPDVPSDLEQMPNLLNFIQNNGTISGNHHTPLISHTATDILTAQTGVYGNRMGIPVSNSYGFFRPDGSVGFTSSFLYWTALSGDGKPQMLNELGKAAPAPWVPFTRAGCDVGGFSVANIEFERVPDDVTTFYGAGSAVDTAVRAQLASASPATRQQPTTDYLGVAIHCAVGSPRCNNGFATSDPLPDEPNGYNGFKGLFGNINVQPVISPSGPVKDLDGNVIADAFGRPGFPSGFSRGRRNRSATPRRCSRPASRWSISISPTRTTTSPVQEHSAPAKPATSPSSSNTTPRSANSLPGSARTASPKTTPCLSLYPTRTIISSAPPLRARRIATALTCPAPTRRARKARSTR